MTTTIIDKNKPLSPKYKWEPTPDFRTQLDRDRYVNEEAEYWIKGRHGLNGFHYFILSQLKLKIGTGGDVGRFIYREADELVTDFFLKCPREKKNGMWLSRREYGKSVFAAAFQAYNIMTNPSCVQTATSASVQKLLIYFQDKFLTCMSGLHPAIMPRKISEGNTKSNLYRKYGQLIIDDYDELKEAEAQFFGIETSETPSSPTNISGQRAKTIVADEIGLHGRASDLMYSADSAVISQGKRTGTIIFTGTVEKQVKNETVIQLRQMVAQQEDLDLIVYFTPFYHALHLNSDGTHNEKSAHEWWEKEYEKKSRLKDESALISFIKNNPRNIDDALGLSAEGNLPPEVLAALSNREKILVNTKVPTRKGVLINKGDNKLEFVLKDKAPIILIENPVEGEEYIAGTDPIPMLNVASEDGSKHVTIIYSLLRETPVAIYAERNLNAFIVTDNVIKLCQYFNNAKNMIENNRGETLIDKMLSAGRKDLLCRQPKKMGLYVKVTSGNQVWGYRKTGSEFAGKLLYDLFCEWVIKFVEYLLFLEIIEDSVNYPHKNSDYIDAFLAVLLLRGEILKGRKTTNTVNAEYIEKKILAPVNGVNKWITVKRRSSNYKE